MSAAGDPADPGGTTTEPVATDGTERAPRRPPLAVVPDWAVRAMAVGGGVLALAAVGWLLFWLLLRLPLVTFAVALALLLTALTAPISRGLRRAGLPAAVAALMAVLTLLGVLLGIGFLVGFRAVSTIQDLTRPLAAGIDRIRVWLIEGPLGLNPQQVADLRNEVVTRLYEVVPDPAAGARMAVYVLGALVLVAFLVFFLLKDGESMWRWLVERVPDRRRDQVDGAGRAAWTTLASYVRGTVVVAFIDAVGIGLGLLLLGVPLWISLTLLTFVGAFIPLLGATVSGAVAVLVTMVTNGTTDAIIILVVVLVVQQVEGNVLQPLIMGHALDLHPVVILVAVTAGGLLFGVAGALLAVPFVAVSYRVLEHVRLHPVPTAQDPPPSRGATAVEGAR
ncbi:AI-2E family transporter [Modestobacter sp. VKM Ac-2977]|uniref:AI-2E family transporter n=1 Tax=Modestobacter sp. VKM Ac-2977 TaxID=3004131 RepID=UPI0022AB4707|nr:AI-2E family transporter [Modestobacter sp. VKM Ac-2977]MCZ2819607.1 AI-2E family transporter [Modestobacter sp. VKM Ac-2977]